MDLATGYVVWQESAPGAWLQLNNVSLADGTLLAVNYDFMFGATNVFAFDALTGALLWSAPCGMSDVPPAVQGSTVIHSCGDNLVPPAITAFDLNTGSQLWQRTGLGSMYAPPASAGGIVYAAVGVYDGWTMLTMSNLTALSVHNGSVLSATATTRGGQAPAIADDVIYTANNGIVYAYRWQTVPLSVGKFSAQIRPAAGGKDNVKLVANVAANPPLPDYGEPVYVRIGDFVVLGEPLGFLPVPERPYVFSIETKASKKTGLMFKASGKNGVYAGMLPYLHTDGVTQAHVPLTVITASHAYFRTELALRITTKKGKVKATPDKAR